MFGVKWDRKIKSSEGARERGSEGAREIYSPGGHVVKLGNHGV
jgi:hypothetical protein